jgi:hypothetical protein
MDMNSQRQRESANGPENPVRRAAYEDALARVRGLPSFSDSLSDEQRARLIDHGPLTVGRYPAAVPYSSRETTPR